MKKHLLTSSRNKVGVGLTNKGFTLIELLAIIVILAIIAVITVPIILNIIENSKKGAATDSAYGYKDSVNKAYITELQNHNKLKLNDTYTVTNGTLSGGNFGDEGITSLPVHVSGTIPSSGRLVYLNNTLIGGCLVIGDYEVKFDSNGSVLETKNGDCVLRPSLVEDNGDEGLSIGDLYEYGSERFYVVDPGATLNGKNVVTLLAEYNLNVGDSKNPNVPEGIQNESIKQTGANQTTYGNVIFSDINYWDVSGKTYPADVYDSVNYSSKPGETNNKYSIAYYVENYKSYLEKIGASIEEARLLTYNEANALGCSGSNCPKTGVNGFVGTTTYWLGSAINATVIKFVGINGYYTGANYSSTSTGTFGIHGVRPVVVIDKAYFE